MIAFAKQKKNEAAPRPPRRIPKKLPRPAWHERYLRLLPDIRRQACLRLYYLDGEAREDAVHEIIADTVVAYARLAELNREELAYVTPLVNYALRKFRSGRRVGNRSNACDVSSPICQCRRRIVVERLGGFQESGKWQELLVEDKRATPADLAAMRLDFRAFLKTLPPRTRRLAETLATGESTQAASRAFNISASRVSQIRLELKTAWHTFIGEPTGSV